jgi:hypothetical protein
MRELVAGLQKADDYDAVIAGRNDGKLCDTGAAPRC